MKYIYEFKTSKSSDLEIISSTEKGRNGVTMEKVKLPQYIVEEVEKLRSMPFAVKVEVEDGICDE